MPAPGELSVTDYLSAQNKEGNNLTEELWSSALYIFSQKCKKQVCGDNNNWYTEGNWSKN